MNTAGGEGMAYEVLVADAPLHSSLSAIHDSTRVIDRPVISHPNLYRNHNQGPTKQFMVHAISWGYDVASQIPSTVCATCARSKRYAVLTLCLIKMGCRMPPSPSAHSVPVRGSDQLVSCLAVICLLTASFVGKQSLIPIDWNLVVPLKVD